jgi:hypothetical protein
MLLLDFLKLQINIISSQKFNLLEHYDLKGKKCCLCEVEGSNLNTMTITLKSIMCFEILGLDESIK